MITYIDSRSKLFQHLDHLAAIKRGEAAVPVNVEIDLSNRCSRGCSWCHFAYTHTRGPLTGKQAKPGGAIPGGDLMSEDLALRILRELAGAGVKSVTWTGGGEPTLHPQFERVIFAAKATGLEQGLYTHGGHISWPRAALLKRTLTWVYVSLDECDAESYQASKGTDGFQPVITGIRNLVSAEGTATVGLGFLLHPANYQRVGQMVTLAHDLGVDYVQFRPTIQYDQAAPGQLAEDTGWIARAQELLRAHGRDPLVVADLDRFEMYRRWQGHGYQTCHWSALQTVITPNGMMWRCTNKREQPGALLGDLSTERFADIWARAGGTCQVDGGCRVMCKGHPANLTLDEVMRDRPHANFI